MNTILFTVQHGVAIITLNRPEKLNAFNREMALSMQQLLDECAMSEHIRCVCITGAGKAFSAGQDLAEIMDEAGPGFKRILSEHYNPIVKKIRALQKPVIAAVNGTAAGAGANIALCCDVVVCTASASFMQAFSKIGLIPDSGGTWFLPRLVGWQRALALAMLGDKISSAEAERMGMVYKVIPDDAFATEVTALASSLAQMPTMALAFIKKAFEESLRHTLDQQLVLEDQLQQEAALTMDAREGITAFVEKRKPSFQGK